MKVLAFLIKDGYRGPEETEQDALEDPAVNSDPARSAEVAVKVRNLQKFKESLKSHVVAYFDSPSKLAENVAPALHGWVMERLHGNFDPRAVQRRSCKQIEESLEAQGYRADLDVREENVEQALFVDSPSEGDLGPGGERSLVRRRTAVLLTGRRGQGKSWRLYRLGAQLIAEGKLAVLIFSRGSFKADIKELMTKLNRELVGSASHLSLRDIQTNLRQRDPGLPDPWLTVLIDGVKDEDHALSLLHHSWEGLGIRVALTCRMSEGPTELGDSRILEVPRFTDRELSRYLSRRLGIEPIFPRYLRDLLTFPFFAEIYCDLGGSPIEYALFERVWSSETTPAPLAAAVVARLASQLPEDQVYPWPLLRVWASGLRDEEIGRLVESGFLRRTDSGRSLEIEDERILCWTVAEGLVGGFRSQEISLETLISRAIRSYEDSDLSQRLRFVAMDTLWLLV